MACIVAIESDAKERAKSESSQARLTALWRRHDGREICRLWWGLVMMAEGESTARKAGRDFPGGSRARWLGCCLQMTLLVVATASQCLLPS